MSQSPGPRPGEAGSDLVQHLRDQLDRVDESAPLPVQVSAFEGMLDELTRRLGEATG